MRTHECRKLFWISKNAPNGFAIRWCNTWYWVGHPPAHLGSRRPCSEDFGTSRSLITWKHFHQPTQNLRCCTDRGLVTLRPASWRNFALSSFIFQRMFRKDAVILKLRKCCKRSASSLCNPLTLGRTLSCTFWESESFFGGFWNFQEFDPWKHFN